MTKKTREEKLQLEDDEAFLANKGYPRMSRCCTCDKVRETVMFSVNKNLAIGVCASCSSVLENYDFIVARENESMRREKKAMKKAKKKR